MVCKEAVRRRARYAKQGVGGRDKQDEIGRRKRRKGHQLSWSLNAKILNKSYMSPTGGTQKYMGDNEDFRPFF